MRRDGPFDVVHGYQGQPAGLVAVLAGRRLGVPSVVTLDSGEFIALPDIAYGLQLRLRHRLTLGLTLRAAARLTVCSRYQEQLARSHGVAPDVIPIGVDAARFARPTADDRGRGRRLPWQLLHVASLNAVKDQTTLLEALALIPDAHLHIVGEDTLSGATASLARQIGLEARITFHGFQPTDALAALYHRADLCLLSSRHEAAGVAVLEAAAAGVATVGTHVGYLAEWSPDRAVTVPPANPAALAGAVAGLLADPDRRRRLAAAAREWTLAHDADWTAAQLDRIYQEIAHQE
jgi:glycosyltransferase involved in cell wall biosynthesis